MDNFTKIRYYMILCRDMLTVFGLYWSFSEHAITWDDRTYEERTTTMVEFSEYIFKPLNSEDKIKSGESSMDYYIGKVFE